MSWVRLRREVYRRDGGLCQACLLPVGRLWDCGHLVDRCVGGTDALVNLYLSCVHCNRRTKPICRTRTEALAWLRECRRAARGQPLEQNWEPFYRAMYAR
jgi:5-methylcytosine-specific restriction endonuclease McrA